MNLSIYPKSNSLNMKNDQYIPHEVSMRSNSQVINLIEAEGAAGYGFYWALLEYLRAQNHYTGDIRAIKNIARQMKIRIDKAIRILNDYGLFVVENTLFSSQFLNERMVSFDRQRARCEAYKRKKDAELVSENVGNVSETPCNPLEIKDTFDTINNKQPQPLKQPQPTTTSSSSKEDVAADDDVIKQPWESHIDSLRHEEQWKEVMTIRSGPARILSAGSTRCCSTSSGTETQNAYISSSETPRRKNAPTAMSTYQLVRHLSQTTRRNGTKKQRIRGTKKRRSKRNLGFQH